VISWGNRSTSPAADINALVEESLNLSPIMGREPRSRPSILLWRGLLTRHDLT
jgi:hypothetical protein